MPSHNTLKSIGFRPLFEADRKEYPEVSYDALIYKLPSKHLEFVYDPDSMYLKLVDTFRKRLAYTGIINEEQIATIATNPDTVFDVLVEFVDNGIGEFPE